MKNHKTIDKDKFANWFKKITDVKPPPRQPSPSASHGLDLSRPIAEPIRANPTDSIDEIGEIAQALRGKYGKVTDRVPQEPSAYTGTDRFRAGPPISTGGADFIRHEFKLKMIGVYDMEYANPLIESSFAVKFLFPKDDEFTESQTIDYDPLKRGDINSYRL